MGRNEHQADGEWWLIGSGQGGALSSGTQKPSEGRWKEGVPSSHSWRYHELGVERAALEQG